MKYVLAIYADESKQVTPGTPEFDQLIAGYNELNDELVKANRKLGGEPLEPTSTATTVRIRNDETLVTDGPFAETKEQLGGFYLIEADDLDEAIAWATRIPTARTGSIEVRPVADFG